MSQYQKIIENDAIKQILRIIVAAVSILLLVLHYENTRGIPDDCLTGVDSLLRMIGVVLTSKAAVNIGLVYTALLLIAFFGIICRTYISDV